ncbi:hypothetical protein [Tumebacillus permanentifrigoris]|uniref:Uncharacterized protein n=1 Tax=Tumebacillus permanentifrigoris TaxID=378543 RepID=A0A316D822_9BACL|nr:hypothetical protein [Tumebacillus permanentifrigoris]PWK11581.1 hypothetical protein C7459_110110 [Tumebacillus permanentifrigoris]
MLRKWLRKVMTGLAAFLIVCVEALGSANLGYSMGPYLPHYGWTDYGMRVQMEQEQEQVRQQQAARLEGEIHEDQLRRDARQTDRGRPEGSSVG